MTGSSRRIVLFALHSERGDADGATRFQLEALRDVADRLVVVVEPRLASQDRAAVAALSDRVIDHDGPVVDARAYREAVLTERLDAGDEIVFTGNGWFGPVGTLEGVLGQPSSSNAEIWRLIETTDRHPESFPLEGFPEVAAPWTWTVVRGPLASTEPWRDYWSAPPAHSEDEFAEHFAARGIRGEVGFPAMLGPRGNPGLLAPGILIQAGCPVLLRSVFAQYPPLLDRFAVLLRPVIAEIEHRGYPVAELWRSVVRTTAPAALNALAGMLEVLPDADAVDEVEPGTSLRVCVIAHVPHLDFVDELAGCLRQIPGEFDLVVTTTDGRKAAKLRTRLRKSDRDWARRAVVRVTWVPGGRDIGAMLIGCKDIMLSDAYDLVIRIHGRDPRRKTLNVREYSRRYQLENLLSSPGYVQGIFDLFRREPGLGMVFPPMVHIGYGTMGRGWGTYREPAEQLIEELGIKVPRDEVSPLAPFGGMWIARPEALRALVERGWSVSDYHRARRARWIELTRVQERLLALTAAEAGYHSRTVLNREHAQLAYTALEYKIDEMSSTTRGYPVEQIHLLRRAGWTGYGGVVALARMYVNVNHPRIAALTQPLYRGMRNTGLFARRVLAAARNEHQDDGSQS
ncbi:rhamnan synthesis F family protein [Microbacterium sp.]|uniref:rhamnan synthesis F family protein n=1 Tax=Microbacterium sp. TaxID=51671 RepID=UPI0025ED8828|nr:rhamnan synthesis F family protein [Microbacterium sp.]